MCVLCIQQVTASASNWKALQCQSYVQHVEKTSKRSHTANHGSVWRTGCFYWWGWVQFPFWERQICKRSQGITSRSDRTLKVSTKTLQGMKESVSYRMKCLWSCYSHCRACSSWYWIFSLVKLWNPQVWLDVQKTTRCSKDHTTPTQWHGTEYTTSGPLWRDRF